MRKKLSSGWSAISDLLRTETDIYEFINDKLDTLYNGEFENNYNSTYKNALFELKKVLYFVSNQDDLIKSLITKRYTQAKSYETNIKFTGLDSLYDAVVQANLWGSALLKVENTKKDFLQEGTIRSKNELDIKVYPQFAWIYCGDEVFLDKNFNEPIDENFFIIKSVSPSGRGPLWSTLVRSISKQFAYNKVYEAANSLNGVNTVNINPQQLVQDLTLLSGGDEGLINSDNPDRANLTFLHRYIEEQIAGIRNNDYLITTDSLKLGHTNLSDTASTSVFFEYIKKMESLIQVAIIGQAGSVFESEVGAFARIKEMNLTTADLKYADLILLEDTVNNIFAKKQVQEKFFVLVDDANYRDNYLKTLETVRSLGLNIQIRSSEFYKNLALEMPKDVPEFFDLV